MSGEILPRRKEFEVADLLEEIRVLRLRIDLLTEERDFLREVVQELKDDAGNERA